MSVKEAKINSGGVALAGGLCLAEHPRGAVLFIAGGGVKSHSHAEMREWQEHLAAVGYCSLAFDFPGVGDSPGELSNSTMNTRLADSENALAYLQQASALGADQIIPCGRSMGGPLALRLAAKHQSCKTILLFPAAYAADGYDVPFGEEFTKVLHRENSWADSSDFDLAENCPGELMVIYGDSDKIIPQPVQDRYLEVGRRKGQAVVIANAAHTGSFLGDAPGNAERRQELYTAVDDFLQK